MGKFSDALLNQPAEAEPAQTPPASGKYSSRVLSGERMGLQEVTPYQQEMLDAGTTRTPGGTFETATGRSPYAQDQKPVEGRGVGLRGNFKAGMVEDPDTKLRLLAEARFPGKPDAVKRFGWRDGNPVFINEQGQLERADSGLLSQVGNQVASLPETVGGIVGSLAPMPVAGSVFGATAGKAVKQVGANLLLDEPQTPGGNAGGLATEALLSGAGGVVGKGVSMAANRTAIPSAEKFDAKATQAVIDRIKASTGIELDSAQAGGVRGLRDLKKWASKYPSDAQEVIEALDQKQADQVAHAIETILLPRISSKVDTAEMATSGVNAARTSIDLAKRKRSHDTRELFATAERDLISPDVLQYLRGDPYFDKELEKVMGNDLFRSDFKKLGLLPELRDSVTNTPIRGPRPASPASPGTPAQSPVSGSSLMNQQLGRRDSVTNMPVQGSSPAIPGKPATRASSLGLGTADRSIKAWDLVLRNLKDAEQTAIQAGEGNKARLIGEKARKLEAQLREASEPYGKARDAWAQASADYVDPLENGVIGVLAKIDGPDVTDKVARLMGSDVLSSPGIASDVRGRLKASGNDQAWNDLLRLSLSKAFDKAAKETQGGDVVNMAGKFRQAIIGTPSQKLALNKAVGDAVHPVFNDLMDALQMIARENRGRAGSDTFSNQAITRQQQSGAPSAITRAVAAPLESARSFLDEKMIQRNAVSFAEALTNPEKVAKLKELRKLKPSQERAIAMLSVVGLGNYSLGAGADAISEPLDAAPQTPPDPQPEAP